MKRCDWCEGDELYIKYHDEEWGKPLHDDNKLFEFLILEGAQAGLSWITILRKRENYSVAFDDFNPSVIANYGEIKVKELLENKGIVRNKNKIISTINNAKVFLDIQQEFGSFDRYIWSFTDGEVIKNNFEKVEDVPAKTPISEAMSKDLKKRGMKYVGPTIMYAYMQAIGIVNDHIVGCCKA